MHDNVPSHAAMAPTSFLESQVFVGETFMTWPPCSPDLNLIEHLRSILEWGVYEGGAIHFKRCPLQQNSRYRQNHYFVPDKTIDLFSGQKVVQINVKNEWYINKYIIYMRLSLQNVSCVCFLYSVIFTANSVQYKVIISWPCLLALKHYFNRPAIKRWTAKIPWKWKQWPSFLNIACILMIFWNITHPDAVGWWNKF